MTDRLQEIRDFVGRRVDLALPGGLDPTTRFVVNQDTYADWVAKARSDIAYLLDRLARYETAFAGMWIEPNQNGLPSVYKRTVHGGRSNILTLRYASESIRDALATVLPTEPPTQGAE